MLQELVDFKSLLSKINAEMEKTQEGINDLRKIYSDEIGQEALHAVHRPTR